MTLTTEQQRWLTEEFLRLCWHEVEEITPTIIKCSCGKSAFTNPCVHLQNLDFTDWRTFGLLMNELDNRWSDEEIAKFLYTLAVEGNPQTFPVRAANYIYDFFNGGNDD